MKPHEIALMKYAILMLAIPHMVCRIRRCRRIGYCLSADIEGLDFRCIEKLDDEEYEFFHQFQARLRKAIEDDYLWLRTLPVKPSQRYPLDLEIIDMVSRQMNARRGRRFRDIAKQDFSWLASRQPSRLSSSSPAPEIAKTEDTSCPEPTAYPALRPL